jgi:hypothetical protein
MHCLRPIVSFWTTMTSLRTTTTVFSLFIPLAWNWGWISWRHNHWMNLFIDAAGSQSHQQKEANGLFHAKADCFVNAKLNCYNCCRFHRFYPRPLLLPVWASEAHRALRIHVVRWEYTSHSLLVHIKTLLRTAIRYGNTSGHQIWYQKISEDRLPNFTHQCFLKRVLVLLKIFT